ncbi:MAG: hypothetical protein M1816_006191 [Peltula sp. TS41687]|nr:MAG: hypothetical protein M1816_006191 [Peltula sp. TS41687]
MSQSAFHKEQARYAIVVALPFTRTTVMDLRSFFGSASRQSLLPQYEHELSTLIDGQTGATSMMPSMTRSLFPSSAPAQPYPSPVALRRRERQLEEELQMLLDAQEAGLVAGYSMESSIGLGSARADARNQPRPRGKTPAQKDKPSLGDARARILAAMRELASVKDEETTALQSQSASSSAIVDQLDGWKVKREGLEKEIHDIESSPETAQLQKLKQDETALQSEIYELEGRLLELRAKQRHMASEMSLMTNVLDAKLSSYRASLYLLENSIKRFVSNPPPPPSPQTDEPEETPAFMTLPANRRTLAMVHEHYKGRAERLSQNVERAEFERDALEDGAHIWEDVLTEVSAYERDLRKALRRSMGASQQDRVDRTSRSLGGGSRDDDDDDSGLSHSLVGPDGVTKVVSETDRLIVQLESRLRLAEARNWKLLVCCIGAELEALTEARGILGGVLTQQRTSMAGTAMDGGDDDDDDDDDDNRMNGSVKHGPERLESSNTGLRESSTGPGRNHVGHHMVEDGDGDDDPDPDLLVSHEHMS